MREAGGTTASESPSLLLETGMIYASIVAAIPLIHLDKKVVGWRRFAWIFAIAIDGYHQYLVVQNADHISGSTNSGGSGNNDEFLFNVGIDNPPSKLDLGGIASTDTLHRLTFAAVTLVMIPHLVNMLQEMGYILALAALPPMGTAFYLALETPAYTPEYWKVQAFLHITLIVIAYLNHLDGTSSSSSSTEDSTPNNDGSGVEEQQNRDKKPKKGKKRMKKV